MQVYMLATSVDPCQFYADARADLSLRLSHVKFVGNAMPRRIWYIASIYSFGAKFQTTFIVCLFFILTNYRLERRLYSYVKLKEC